jgi:hypothetical protein
MVRSAIILAAAFLACMIPGRPASAEPDPGYVRNCLLDTATGMKFANTLKFIATGYDPTGARNRPSEGTSTVSPSVRDQMIHNIAKAFTLAPLPLQQLLCNLDGIYIDPNPKNGSWGYRDQATFKNRYIALSITLFDNSGSAIAFDTYSTSRLNQIFNMPLPYTTFYYGLAKHGATDINDSAFTVLAVLAHEEGHIFWNDKFKTNGTYDYSKFCHGNFLDFHWSTKPAPNPWTPLGQTVGTHKSDLSSDNVNVPDIAAAKGNAAKVLPVLQGLYGQKSRWASALGAFSPNEDFVETFEDVILTYSGTSYALTSQPLYYKSGVGAPVMIGDRFQQKQHFKVKKDCFAGM